MGLDEQDELWDDALAATGTEAWWQTRLTECGSGGSGCVEDPSFYCVYHCTWENLAEVSRSSGVFRISGVVGADDVPLTAWPSRPAGTCLAVARGALASSQCLTDQSGQGHRSIWQAGYLLQAGILSLLAVRQAAWHLDRLWTRGLPCLWMVGRWHFLTCDTAP